MLKHILRGEPFKNLTRNNFRYICKSKVLSQADKCDKTQSNQKSDQTCDIKAKVEKTNECDPCQGKKDVKCKKIEDKSQNIKICEKEPCIKPESRVTEPPCGKSPCKSVVCDKKKDEPKEIVIEPLISCGFNESKVVIIGAGLAGLAAAKYLEENQISNYIILEAQNRPGGRIHSEWFSDTVVELGAPSPKTTNDVNSFMQSAMVDGFIKPPLSYMSIFKTCDGHSISPTIGMIGYEMFKRIYCESIELGSNDLEYMNFKMEQEVSQFPPYVQQDLARVLLGILAMKYRIDGDHLSQFIQRDMCVCLQSPGGRLRVPLGYYGIVQPMMTRIPKDNIKFNKPVQCVRWGAVVCKDTPRALVKCCDGSVYPADYVIVTISLGVLKDNHDTFFCPALPSEKVDAIESMSFYNLNKMYLQFSEPFWAWTTSSIDIKRCDREKKLKKAKGWTKGISVIQQVPGSSDVLYVGVDGKEASIVEKLSDTTIIDGVVKMIKKDMLIKNIPCVKNSLISRWSNNVYFKGSYSVLPKGVPDGIQQTLSNPLPGNNAPVNPILFFAGEATCPKLNGSVQAAKISGIREAARIKKLITNDYNMDMTEEDKLSVSL